MSAARPVVIFLHIPKTAGTAINTLIARSFPAGSIYTLRQKEPARLEQDLAALTFAEPMRLRVISGHQCFGLHEMLRVPTTYATFLREPLKRLLSLYHYAREMPTHFQHEELISGRMTLLDLAEANANRQTRLIAGKRHGPLDRADLERAQEHLSTRFAVAGITERLEESVALLQWELGWPVRPLTRENVTTQRSKPEALAPELVQTLREMNAFDLQLYTAVAERLARQLEAQPPAFRRSLARFRALNRLASLLRTALGRWRGARS